MAWRIVVAFLVLYILPYVLMTSLGRYKSDVWGLAQGPKDTAILVPKRGYDWHPFQLYADEGRATLRLWIYFPLIHGDRAI